MKNLELYQKATYLLCKEVKKRYGVDAVPQEVINNTQVDPCTEVDGTPVFLLSTRHKGRYVSMVRPRTAIVKMRISDKWRNVRPTDVAGFSYYYTYNCKYWKDSPVRHVTVQSPTWMTKEEFIAKEVAENNYYWFQMGTWTNRQYVANVMRRNVANV